MNIDTFLKLFVPKDHSFFPLFEHGAENMTKAADLLRQLMATQDISEHERINKEIKDLEHIGDGITDSTYEQLNKSLLLCLTGKTFMNLQHTWMTLWIQ